MNRSTVIALLLAATACGQDEPAPLPVAVTTTTVLPTTSPPTTVGTTIAPPTTAQRTTSTTRAVVQGNIAVPNMVGQDLQLAQDTMQAAGLYSLRSHDATGLGRLQVLDRAWKVCDQTPAGGARVTPDQVIDFGVVRDEEQCP